MFEFMIKFTLAVGFAAALLATCAVVAVLIKIAIYFYT